MAKKGSAKQSQRDKTRSAEDFERIKRTEVVSPDHISTNPVVPEELAEEYARALLPSIRARVFSARKAKERSEADRKRAAKKARQEARAARA